MPNTIILAPSEEGIKFQSLDLILEKMSHAEHLAAICPECEHSRIILDQSLHSRDSARKQSAREIINNCSLCKEYFKILPEMIHRPEMRALATLRIARKTYQCTVSHQPINTGCHYYQIVTCGAGVAGFKYPDRVLPEHLNLYWKYRAANDINGAWKEYSNGVTINA